MAIDAKISFLNQLEQKLADQLTVDNMNALMRVASDILEGFEMREANWKDDHEDDLLQSFVDAMKVQGRSQKTIDRYVYVIGRLMDFIKVPTRRVTVYHIRAYISAEKERGIKDSTLEGLREVFSAYFNWLQRESLIEKNPMANMGTFKTEKVEKLIFSETDMAKMDSGCKTIRDKALIQFMASTGCRISEITGLNWESINFAERECIVHGKGNKERTVYMSAVASMYLQQYLNSRKDSNPALFLNHHGNRIAPGGVRMMLNELAACVGVEHVHPHKFRRTLATELARRGMPIQEIAKILGHESIETTMKYVVLNKDDIKSSYRRYA